MLRGRGMRGMRGMRGVRGMRGGMRGEMRGGINVADRGEAIISNNRPFSGNKVRKMPESIIIPQPSNFLNDGNHVPILSAESTA
jgi:hypothetical protein